MVFREIRQRYGEGSAFLDVDSRSPGLSFPVKVARALDQSDVVLVFLGPTWLQVLNERRNDPRDWVRYEIAESLRRPDLPVVPVCRAGVEVPSADDLPEEIRELAWRDGVSLDPFLDFDSHVARLFKDLERVFEELAADRKRRVEAEELTIRERERATRQAQADEALHSEREAQRRNELAEVEAAAERERERHALQTRAENELAAKREAQRRIELAEAEAAAEREREELALRVQAETELAAKREAQQRDELVEARMAAERERERRARQNQAANELAAKREAQLRHEALGRLAAVIYRRADWLQAEELALATRRRAALERLAAVLAQYAQSRTL